MKRTHSIFIAALAALIAGGQAAAQQAEPALALNGGTNGAAVADTVGEGETEEATAAVSTAPPIRIQYFRPQDTRGLTIFEAPKEAGAPFTGFSLEWGAAFAQQFQALDHRNAAAERVVDGTNLNRLMPIGAGFNNATANLYLHAQLAPGIRVALETYLSSRHHPEAWVKDGYILIDESPLGIAFLDEVMRYTTVKVGHFEINYGDAHFRRTDNGNAFFNPFVGNYIMDGFTTEIGAEVYLRANGLMAMAGVTGGEIKGNVTRPDDRALSYLAKLGFDRDVTEDLRLRLTGSMYTTPRSISNTLYGGDRAGSRYYFVMENALATEAAQFTSGLINPGFRSEIRAFQVNPFVKFRGLELFGVAETARGRAANETDHREWTQYAADAVYRFLADERLYVGGRYNVASGQLTGMSQDVSIDRFQFGAGWFVTPTLLLKGEYVTQRYEDFPLNDIRHGGRFNGFMMEGVISF